MIKKRVVITGLGAITPLGNTINELWGNLCNGKSGVTTITKFDASLFPTKISGEVKDFNPGNYNTIDKKDVRRMGTFLQYALAASELAIKDSEIDLTKIDRTRAGVIIGSGMGDIEKLISEQKELEQKGARSVSATFVPMAIPSMASGIVSIKLGLNGPSFGLASACATGTHSIGESLRKIQYGDADIMLTGGTEGALTPVAFAGFCASRTLSKNNDFPEKASKPFDAERDGFVMSEGAGVVVLEELSHALNRNAKIYAEIIGYGARCDAFHITAPHPEGYGAVLAIEQAIMDAGIFKTDIDYINAHGTSTELNDKLETKAIKKVFGEQAYNIPISSIKSMIGHLINAVGAIEIITCALILKDGIIPPTINYEKPDPECDLNYVPNKAIKKDVKILLKNAFAFGGQNAVLVLRKY